MSAEQVSEVRLELRERLSRAGGEKAIGEAIRWAYGQGLAYDLIIAELQRHEHWRRVFGLLWFIVGVALLGLIGLLILAMS